jgi:hypothetical protein
LFHKFLYWLDTFQKTLTTSLICACWSRCAVLPVTKPPYIKYWQHFYILFLYNSINRENIWSVLRRLKVLEYLLVEMKQMCSDCTDCVKITVGRSGWFKTSSGVSQKTRKKPILINAMFMIIGICICRIFIFCLF